MADYDPLKLGVDAFEFDKYFMFHDCGNVTTKIMSWRVKDGIVYFTIANGKTVQMDKSKLKEESFDAILSNYVEMKICNGFVTGISIQALEKPGTVYELAQAMGMRWKTRDEFLLYVLHRLLPIFGINVIEFSPPGTGKSTVASIYPNFYHFTSSPSVPELVYNIKKNEYGVVLHHDGLVFDEVQHWKIDHELIAVLSTGLEEGIWVRGKIRFKKNVTAVFFGNPRANIYSRDALTYYKIFTPALIQRFHVVRHYHELPKIVGGEINREDVIQISNFLKKQIKAVTVQGETMRETRKLSELYSVVRSLGIDEKDFQTDYFN